MHQPHSAQWHRTALAAAVLSLGALPGLAAGAEDTEARERVEQLERELEEVKERLDATAAMAERGQGEAGESEQRVHIGGYGELHYNNWDNQLAGGSDKDEIDFHRFVLEFGYAFTDRMRFFSEVELEHALSGDGAPGEVELEQAYVEFDLSDRHRARGGVFLVPVGILNETHEPPTFYGVERNPIEHDIIPATWWVGGAGVSGELAPGLSYDVGLHEGLKTSAADTYGIRAGRQKTAEADASDLAATGRLKWTAMPGLEVAGTVQYQSDITQGADASAGGATLVEAHAVWNNAGSHAQQGFGARALYARWDLDGSGPAGVGADVQEGWYIEPSYKVTANIGVFGRYNVWDNQAGGGPDSELTQWDLGVSYWPHPQVVIKADYQNQDSPAGEDELDGFNLGIGYQF